MRERYVYFFILFFLESATNTPAGTFVQRSEIQKAKCIAQSRLKNQPHFIQTYTCYAEPFKQTQMHALTVCSLSIYCNCSLKFSMGVT